MSEFDKAVLAYYQREGGATAWICSLDLQVERKTVSAALQRLKRKGLVRADGSYWKAAIVSPVLGETVSVPKELV